MTTTPCAASYAIAPQARAGGGLDADAGGRGRHPVGRLVVDAALVGDVLAAAVDEAAADVDGDSGGVGVADGRLVVE
jgi:hypothetical protein